MTRPIGELWVAALAADASYTRDINGLTIGGALARKLAPRLTQPLADYLAFADGATPALVSLSQSSEITFASGYSGTLFKYSGVSYLGLRGTESPIFDARDLLQADRQIALNGLARDQAVDLYRHWRMLTTAANTNVTYSAAEIDFLYSVKQGFWVNLVAPDTDPLRTSLASDRGLGLLSSTDRVTVVGHSLGGHLVQIFSQFFPDAVEAAYTFNAPGFGGALAQLVDFFFPTSLDIQSSLVTNYVADHGFDVTARLGVLVGDTQRIFNESGGNPVDNHFMEKLTDSLSVYNLLSQVDPSLSLRVIGGILDSTSNVASRSLETAVDSLRALVRPGIALPATDIGDRTGFNAVVVDLLHRLPEIAGSSVLGVQSLVELAPGDVAQRASRGDGIAFRYALDRLQPYALTGLDYGSIDPAGALALGSSLGETWIRDRAELLSWMMARNFVDGDSAMRRTDGGPATEYIWTESGDRHSLQVRPGALPVLASRKVFFGGAADDEYSGAAQDDRLHGGAGNDVLHGGVGNDELDGGVGSDLLFGDEGDDSLAGGGGDDVLNGGAGFNRLNGGDGFDRYVIAAGSTNLITDTDGLGSVTLNGAVLAGGAGARGLYWNDDKSVYYTLTHASDGTEVLGVNGVLTIAGFQNGRLGVTLVGADGPEPPPVLAAATHHYENSAISADELALLDADPDYLVVYPYGSPVDDVLIAGPDWNRFFLGRGGEDYLEGADGTTALLGGAGDDYVVSGDRDAGEAPLLSGEAGNDFIVGSEDGDVIYGDFYNVRLESPAGAPAIRLRLDEDLWTIVLPGVNATWPDGLSEVLASEERRLGISSEFYGLPPSTENIGAFLQYVLGRDYASSAPTFDDDIDGGDGDDVIIGGPGSDVIFGGAGNDVIYGDDGRPGESPYSVNFLPGDLRVLGDYSPLFGADGDDYIDAGDGDDFVVDAGGAHSTVIGGKGDDRLFSTAVSTNSPLTGSADVDAGEGNDTVVATAPWVSVSAGEGDDDITVESLNAWIDAGDGNDRIEISSLSGELSGGDGDDTYLLSEGSPFGTDSSRWRTFTIDDSAGNDALVVAGDPGLYTFTRDGDDLNALMDIPALVSQAQAGLQSAASEEETLVWQDRLAALEGVAPLNLVLTGWFAAGDHRIETITFAGTGEVWTADDLEAAVSSEAGAALSRSALIDSAFDPGEPASAPDEEAGGTGEGTEAADGEPSGVSLAKDASADDAGADHLALLADDLTDEPAIDDDMADATDESEEGTGAASVPRPQVAATNNPPATLAAIDVGADVPNAGVPGVVTQALVSSRNNTSRPADDAIGDAGPSADAQRTEELIAAFFAHTEAPPLAAQQWLDTWLPAGDRSTASTAPRQDAPSNEQRTAPVTETPVESPPPAEEVGQLTPEAIASQYARIDEWLAEHPGWDEAGVAAFVDSSGFGGMASALAFDAGSTSGLRFAATPGFMQLPGLALQRLRGLSEGFRALL